MVDSRSSSNSEEGCEPLDPSGGRPLFDELRLVGYSAGNFGKNLLLTSADVTLLFLLTDRLSIAPSVAGVLMLVAFIANLIIDIIVGAVVTWARTKGISYRFFVLAGAVPCGAAFALLYALPWLGAARFWAIAAALVAFRGAYSVVDVPHNALLAEITSDSRGRGRASGYRFIFSALAALAVAGIIAPSIATDTWRALPGSLAEMGLAAGCCFILAMLIAASCSQAKTLHPRIRGSFSLRMIFPKFDNLTAAMAAIAILTGFAMPMFGRMILYVSTYVLGEPRFASQALIAMSIGQFGGALLWTLLVRRFDKTTLLAAGHVLNIVGVVGFACAGANLLLIIACTSLIGLGLASVFMFPWGLLADVVDFAEYRHGERRETALFAAFLVVIKASGAASVAFVGWVMAEVHYTAGMTQAPATQLGVKLLAYGLPLLGSVLSIILVSVLPITHAKHKQLLLQLERRRG